MKKKTKINNNTKYSDQNNAIEWVKFCMNGVPMNLFDAQPFGQMLNAK